MLDNPIDAYLRVAQARNQNRQQANQDLGALGQGVGGGITQIAQGIQQQKQKEQWKQTINSLMQDPSTSPQVKQMLPMLAQRPELAGQVLPGLMKSQKQPNSFRPVSGMMSEEGNPLVINEATGEMSPANIKAKTTNPRTDATNARTAYFNKALDYRQRNLLSKNTNLPAQQLKMLTQNNIRADRAVDLLSKPNVTWQALGFGLTDLGAMMQGGVPHKDQLLDSQFPSWKQKVAQYKTFVTGNPTANVPEPIRQEVLRMIQSVKEVDNKFLEQNKNLQMGMLGPTVSNFEQLKPLIEQGTQNFMNPGKSNNPSSQDQEAVNWARQNSNDPRAKRILQLHGF